MAIATCAIGLAQLCGIEEIGLIDIIEGLSMSFMFGTIARHIVASIRQLHATQVYNLALKTKGSSENVATQFAVKAKNFLGPREVIGRWRAGCAVLHGIKVKVVARPDINEPKIGEGVWCMSGWAETLNSYTTKASEMVGTDIHGNQLICDEKSSVKLSLKRVNGILMAKVKQVWLCDAPDRRKKISLNGKLAK